MQTHAADGTFDKVGAGTSQNSVKFFKIAEGIVTKVDNIQTDHLWRGDNNLWT